MFQSNPVDRVESKCVESELAVVSRLTGWDSPGMYLASRIVLDSFDQDQTLVHEIFLRYVFFLCHGILQPITKI